MNSGEGNDDMDATTLELFFSRSPAGFCILNITRDPYGSVAEYCIRHVNPSFSGLVGRKNERLDGWVFGDLFHDEPQIAVACKELFDDVFERKTHRNIDLRMTQKDESKYLRAFYIDENHLGVILRDTTKEQVLMQEIDSFMHVNVELFVIADPSGNILKANRRFESVLGFDKGELSGRNLYEFIIEDDREATKEVVAYLTKEGQIHEFVNRYRRKDGEILTFEWHSELIDNIIYASARDVTARQKESVELAKVAVTDALTQIYNRHHFYRTMEDAIHDAELKERTLTLILFDIDFFKRVNDTFGHPVGDKVLVHIASVVKDHIRSTDVAFRMGGEEFAIFLPDAPQTVGVQVAKRILRTMNEVPIEDVGYVTASFGVASREVGESLTRWYARTDNSLYRAKHSGRNCVKTAQATDKVGDKMEALSWKAAWTSGHAEIDKQHRELVQIANRLLSAQSEGSRDDVIAHLSDLIEHLADHFQFEESVLTKLRYAKTEEHRILHRRLMEKLATLKGRYLRETIPKHAFLRFLRDDLIVGHLIEQDAPFFPLLTQPKSKTTN
jgi:diguanylate cyclase (GGDEF)-like protein/hemerythrin-like metal-binding protein/PAS domain S-box-containing protein